MLSSGLAPGVLHHITTNSGRVPGTGHLPSVPLETLSVRQLNDSNGVGCRLPLLLIVHRAEGAADGASGVCSVAGIVSETGRISVSGHR